MYNVTKHYSHVTCSGVADELMVVSTYSGLKSGNVASYVVGSSVELVKICQ